MAAAVASGAPAAPGVEEGGFQYQLPGGMMVAEDASVQEHMASHGLAVEQAAAAAHPPPEDKKTGVPEEVLKALPVLTFEEALERAKEPPEEEASDDCKCESGCDQLSPEAVHVCGAKAKRIPGLQVDSEEQDRTCEICQCGYEGDEEVMMLPCKHFYHKPCVSRWLEMRKTCPKCRHQVAPADQNDDASAQGVIVRRTTTIEWVPVVRWVPSSSTTVEVRTEVGSDVETVTTTTTRNTSITQGQIASAPLPQAINQSLNATPPPNGAGPALSPPAMPNGTPSAPTTAASLQQPQQAQAQQQTPPNASPPSGALHSMAPYTHTQAQRFIINPAPNVANITNTHAPHASPPLHPTHAHAQEHHGFNGRLSVLSSSSPTHSPSPPMHAQLQQQSWMAMPPLGPSARMMQQGSFHTLRSPSQPVQQQQQQPRRTLSADGSAHQIRIVQMDTPSALQPNPSGSITPPLAPGGPNVGVPPMASDNVGTMFF